MGLFTDFRNGTFQGGNYGQAAPTARDLAHPDPSDVGGNAKAFGFINMGPTNYDRTKAYNVNATGDTGAADRTLKRTYDMWNGVTDTVGGAIKDAGKPDMEAMNAAIDKGIFANRPDVNGPFGSTDWTKNADGTWSMSQGFNGQLGGASNSLQQQMADALSRPAMTGDQARDQAINGAYSQATSRLDPMWNQREEQMRTRLLNQGLDPQSEAYANALSQFGRDRNDAYSSAMNGAIGQGTVAGQATFNMNQQARSQPLQDMLGMRGLLPGAPQGGGADYAEAQRHADEQQGRFWQNVANGVKTGAELLY